MKDAIVYKVPLCCDEEVAVSHIHFLKFMLKDNLPSVRLLKYFKRCYMLPQSKRGNAFPTGPDLPSIQGPSFIFSALIVCSQL